MLVAILKNVDKLHLKIITNTLQLSATAQLIYTVTKEVAILIIPMTYIIYIDFNFFYLLYLNIL